MSGDRFHFDVASSVANVTSPIFDLTDLYFLAFVISSATLAAY